MKWDELVESLEQTITYFAALSAAQTLATIEPNWETWMDTYKSKLTGNIEILQDKLAILETTQQVSAILCLEGVSRSLGVEVRLEVEDCTAFIFLSGHGKLCKIQLFQCFF